MYNLILVDDEEIVLNSIQKVFQLENYKFKIVGAYTNPYKALEEIKALSPHLIITDIKMPHMDGLEFSAKAKAIIPNVEIVVLSGHDDFIFAQTAMKLGISDYLLKPIKKKDFESMLITMYKKIQAALNLEQQFKILRNVPLSNSSILRNKFFSTIMEQRDPSDPTIKNLYNKLEFTFAENNFILVKFVVKEIFMDTDYISTIEKLTGEFLDHVKNYGLIEEFYIDEHLYFYIYNLDSKEFSLENFKTVVMEFMKEKNNQGLNLLSGVSKVHTSMYDLFFAVSECDEFILNENKALVQDKLSSDRRGFIELDLYFPYSEIESLFLAIFSNDIDKITTSIENILNLPSTTIYMDFSYSIALIIMIRLCHIQNKYDSKDHFITRDLLKIERLKQRCPTNIQLKNLLIDKTTDIAELISSKSNVVLSKSILAAVQYIETHFNENISLADVADYIYISKNYLCDLFKKELNTTFLDHLTNLRVEKAKYYLTKTDMKMYQIAAAVGYNDYAYFSQIFKNHVGVSLSKYRKQH
jgi:two-component system response regulator YesN